MSTRKAQSATAGDVLLALDALAPLADAADWDNVGLLAGDEDWPATRVLVALDLTDDVAREIFRKKCDCVVTYHPPIFKGTQTITRSGAFPTSLMHELLAARVSILSTHTALDAADGGTNDLLLDAFDLVSRRPLEPLIDDAGLAKLVVFAPTDEVDGLRDALSCAGAGQIGAYSACSFETSGTGTFRGDDSTRPVVGQRERLERVPEVRLEMVVPSARVADVVRVIHDVHSYEEPAFDLVPLQTLRRRARVGMGRVGELRKATRGETLVRSLADVVDLSNARVVGSLRRRFRRVIVAAGSFGVGSFKDPDALALTGEFRHHDAMALLKVGVTAVHLGHYESEQPVLALLRSELRARVRGLRVDLSRASASPFSPLFRIQRRGTS